MIIFKREHGKAIGEKMQLVSVSQLQAITYIVLILTRGRALFKSKRLGVRNRSRKVAI